MAILMTAHQSGGTADEAARFRSLLHEKLRQAPGFIFHVDGPIDGGWQIVNAWETRADYERWFEQEVKPHLRAGQGGVQPSFTELANVVLRASA